MRILAIVVMCCTLLGTGCAGSGYNNDIAAYKVSKYGFPIDSEHHVVKPLDKQQIEKMAKQLIPQVVHPKAGKVILASKDEKIMKDFQEHLNKELPEGWYISWKVSDVDVIVTCDLFGEVSTEVEGVRFKIRDTPPTPARSVNPALFLFWTVETDLKVKKVLSATDNYENPKITAAIADLAKNLKKEPEKDWKIALINKAEDSEDSKLVTAAVLSECVTTPVLREIVNAKTSLIFLNKDDTSKHNTELRQGLWPDKDQQTDFAENFSKSTGANVVLIIEQLSEGHFDLKLIAVPSLDLLSIGKSE